MPFWGQLSFQDAASPIMTQLIAFHDHAMLLLTLVITVVGYASLALLMNKFSCRYILEAQEIETIWTILPALTLLFLALPSLRLLYLMDEVSQPAITVKTIAHQWYWSYEYTDFANLEFDAYMLPTEELQSNQFRLLEVDHRTILPMQTEVRMLITSADVIHSWAVPSLGVKVDAIPGRLNQIGCLSSRPGVFYGQCSEICGANHSFMPISVEFVDYNSFSQWVTTQSE
uniref:cytochrome c oxidase subunit II n=1 Tax=Pilargis verrucosa TaxID=1818081 RepID=UPI0030DFAA2C